MGTEISKAIDVIKGQLSPELAAKLEKQHVFELLKLAGEGKIQEQQLAALMKGAPTLANLATESVKSLPKIADKAAEVQSKALDVRRQNFAQTISALEKTATECQTDDARVVIARLISDEHQRSCNAESAMNSSNNELHGKGLSVAGAAIAAVGAILLAVIRRGR